MIKNVIFDIGNVILNFDYRPVIKQFTEDEEEQEFIFENIINSPEWLKYGLIDTGYISRENAISIVQDRTNHEKDDVIFKFWTTYNDYASVDERVIKIINDLKSKHYGIYLLSNINPYTVDFVKQSGLFGIVDGAVLSFEEHQVKPYEGIYKTLLNRYNLDPDECLFIDDNIKNINTAIKLGIHSAKVEPDNYESVVNALNEHLTQK